MAKLYGKGKTAIESEEQQKLRWQVELEFVQCLANPNYLNFLAQRGYFKDQTFVNYIKYLQYWKEPDYAKFLMYPMCLYFLDLLQFEHFRREIVSAQCCKFIDEQAILQWQHYTRKRVKMLSAVNELSMRTELLASSTTGTGLTSVSAAGTTAGAIEATTAEQIQQQQQQQQQGAQKTNPASGGSLQNGLNTGGPTGASGNQAQSQPSAQQTSQQSSQQQPQGGGGGIGASSQQQMNGLSGNSSSVSIANIKMELS